MKRHIKNTLSFIVFTTLTIFILVHLGYIFIPTDWNKDLQGPKFSVKSFYELPKNQIDVLFLGDSDLYRDISPMEMYESKGITSYVLGTPSSRIYIGYYHLKEALKYQKPKIVVVDTPTFFVKKREPETQRRKAFDYLKFSINKIEMINSDAFDFDFNEKLSFLLPILRYHSRYNDLVLEDVKEGHNEDLTPVTKGYVMSHKIHPNKKGYKYMKPKNRELSMFDNTNKYLHKVVELCNEKNIELIFLSPPDAKAWNYESSIKMQEIAKETNTRYLDLNDEDKYPIDWNIDTSDKGTHMNLYGALKITKYVEDYLDKNYDLEDHRNDLNYVNWNDDLEVYHQKKNIYLKKLAKKVKKLQKKQ